MRVLLLTCISLLCTACSPSTQSDTPAIPTGVPADNGHTGAFALPALSEVMVAAQDMYWVGGIRVTTEGANSDVTIAKETFAERILATKQIGKNWVFVLADGTVRSSADFTGATKLVGTVFSQFKLVAVPERFVLHTADGQLWLTDGVSLRQTLEPYRVKRVVFSSRNDAIALSMDGTLLVTSNGGVEWQKSRLPLPQSEDTGRAYRLALQRHPLASKLLEPSTQKVSYLQNETIQNRILVALARQNTVLAMALGFRLLADGRLLHQENFIVVEADWTHKKVPPPDATDEYTDSLWSEKYTFNIDTAEWVRNPLPEAGKGQTHHGNGVLLEGSCPQGSGDFCYLNLRDGKVHELNQPKKGAYPLGFSHRYTYWKWEGPNSPDEFPSTDAYNKYWEKHLFASIHLGRTELETGIQEQIELPERAYAKTAEVDGNGNLIVLLRVSSDNNVAKPEFNSVFVFSDATKHIMRLPKQSRAVAISNSGDLATARTKDGLFGTRDGGRTWFRISEPLIQDDDSGYTGQCFDLGCWSEGWGLSNEGTLSLNVIASQKKSDKSFTAPMQCSRSVQKIAAQTLIDAEFSLIKNGIQYKLQASWKDRVLGIQTSGSFMGKISFPSSWSDNTIELTAYAGTSDSLLFTAEGAGERRWYVASHGQVHWLAGLPRYWSHDYAAGMQNGTFVVGSYTPFYEFFIVEANGKFTQPFVPYVDDSDDVVTSHDGIAISAVDGPALFWGASEENLQMVGFTEPKAGTSLVHVAYASGRREALVLDFDKAMHTPCYGTDIPKLAFFGASSRQSVHGLEGTELLNPEFAELHLKSNGSFCVSRTSISFAPGDGSLIGLNMGKPIECTR